MFLLKVQCVDSILIELSVLRNEARSQRKEAISYLASSYIVGDKCVLEHYLFDSGTVHPVAEPKVHLQHRTNCPSQVEVNRDHRAAQTHFPDKTQKLQLADGYTGPSPPSRLTAQRVNLTDKRNRKQRLPVVPPPHWESAEMMPGYLRHRKSNPYR